MSQKLAFLTRDLRVPFDLNIARFFYYFLFLNNIWSEIYWRVNRHYSYQLISQEFWDPIGIFHFYPKELLLSWSSIYFIYVLFCVSLLFCMIGLYTRIFSIVAAILSVFCLGYVNNHGTTEDSLMLPVVVLFVLALSNMGSSYSLDSFFKSKKNKGITKKSDLFLNQFTLKILSVLLLLFYFTSGFQKIRLSGVDWFMDAELMNLGLLEMGHPWGQWLLQLPWVVKSLAFAAVALQLLCIFPIFLPRLIPYFVVALFFGFHLMLDMTLTNHFALHTYTFLFLVPWKRLQSYFSREKNKNELFKEPFNKEFSAEFFLKGKGAYLSILRKVDGWEYLRAFLFGGILFLAILAPLLKEDLYPFSRTTMYSYPEEKDAKGRFVRRFIFGVDQNGKKRILSWGEIRPISRDKVWSLLQKLNEQGDYERIKEVARALKKNQPHFMGAGLNTLEEYYELSVESCFWKDVSLYLKRKGKSPDSCEIILRIKL